MISFKRFSLFTFAILLTVICAATYVPAQQPPLAIKPIRPSQKASVMQTVGVTDITITYSRPPVKGRTIFADAPATMEARAKGEATLVRRKPLHHGATARRVDTRPGGPGKEDQHDQRPEPGRGAGGDQRAGTEGEPGRQHEPFATPVGEQSPGQQRQQRPNPEAVEHDADLHQAQPMGVAQLRGEHRQADDHGRERGLCGRPRREDQPAVAAQHGPNANSPRAARLAPWPSA